MKKRRLKDGMGLIEIAEASLHQVRVAPLDVLTPYYVGTLPFTLAFLYFWADMSRGAFAYRHVHTSALLVAGAFIWMKCWQAIYCAKMRANLAGGDTGRWGVARIVRLVSTQTIVHATGPFVLPVAFILMVPFGMVYAFYQNATVFGADEDNGVTDVARRAWAEARRWQKQNHQIIWLFSPLALMVAAGLMLVMVPISRAVSPDWGEEYLYVLVFFYTIVLVPLSPIGMLVAFNVGMTIVMAPRLLDSILGIELTVLMGGNFFNSTFFAICVGIASLCLDPVLKAAYTLRCFHGESLSSGEDLRIELRRIIASKSARMLMIAAAGLSVFAAAPFPARAQEQSGQPAVRAQELDEAISAELQKAAYQWRMPKEIPEDAFEDNAVTRFIRSIQETIGAGVRWFIDVLQWIAEALLGGDRGSASSGGIGDAWMTTQRALWFLVFGALLVALGIIVYRIYRQRKVQVLEAVATPVPVTPNLEDEDVSADALPEDGWLNLARDLMERGDLRLAMRALFLASLAVLSHKELIRITKAKSNREYLCELQRRAHAAPGVPPIFENNMRAFERVWYGNHEVDRFAFSEFNANQERIRQLAKQQ